MKRGWVLLVLRAAGLAVYLGAYYGLLYFSVFSFLGESVAQSPFGPTSILMVLVAATGLPVLRAYVSDHLDRHRSYLLLRWGLMLLYLVVGIPVALGLIEYGGPFNLVALALGAALSLAFFLFAAAVSLPLYFFATGMIRAKPGHLHTGAFLALVFFPLTTFRLFLSGSDDFGAFFLAFLILAGLLIAWDWGEIAVKITGAVRGLERGLSYNVFESGLAVYVASGPVAVAVAFGFVLLVKDLLVERTILGGPTSYFHVFFWMGMLLVGVLAIGVLVRWGRGATPEPVEPDVPQAA
jgi:hypothetical protein